MDGLMDSMFLQVYTVDTGQGQPVLMDIMTINGALLAIRLLYQSINTNY